MSAATRPLVAELAGVAGAGKTTLLRQLARDGRFAEGVRMRRRHYARSLGALALALLPAYAQRAQPLRWPSRDELRSMVYLHAWQRAVRRPQAGAQVRLLDHGPVFRLAALRAWALPPQAHPAYVYWWERSLEQWRATLDLVIWLDAPDEVLIERINQRARGHAVKQRPAAEARAFLARYRAAFEQILARMAGPGGPAVLRIDTAGADLAAIAEQVRGACNLEHRA